MKVKLIGILATEEGCFKEGSVVDLPNAVAKQLLESGQAEKLEERKEEVSVEVAQEKPGQETAEAPRARKRR